VLQQGHLSAAQAQFGETLRLAMRPSDASGDEAGENPMPDRSKAYIRLLV